jgi:hypothetical protein
MVYVLPVSPESALTWYEQAFVRRGYAYQVGSGSSSDVRTGALLYWTMIDFRPRTNPRLDVQLVLQADQSGTIAAYNAWAVTVPPRAPGSFIPANVFRVVITYTFLNAPPGKHIIRVAVAKRAPIDRLVTAINALPRSDEAPVFCAFGDKSAALQFVTAGGKIRSVTVDAGCDDVVVAGYPPLAGNPSLWTLLYAVAPPGVCVDAAKCP